MKRFGAGAWILGLLTAGPGWSAEGAPASPGVAAGVPQSVPPNIDRNVSNDASRSAILDAIPDANADAAPQAPTESADDREQLDLVVKGATELKAGRRQEALAIFDAVIDHYRRANAGEKRDIYCAREAPEALFYLARAANQHRDARVIGPAWANAYMLKGYALVELGRTKEARAAVEAAIALSPFNSQFLGELGYLHQVDRAWTEALATYELSAEGARSTSPESSRNSDLARALRGQGYALTELGRLDEAEAVYRKCLELDSADAKAVNELRYIQSLRDTLRDKRGLRDKRAVKGPSPDKP